MAQFELVMPKLGESVQEATITRWFVKVGDKIKDDDMLLEIATDKIDSEIPSPVSGTVTKILYQQDEIVAVGTVIAVIDTDGGEIDVTQDKKQGEIAEKPAKPESPVAEDTGDSQDLVSRQPEADVSSTPVEGRFYSPLVRKIATEEKITEDELNSIAGSGRDGRVQKQDVLNYLKNRSAASEMASRKDTRSEPAVSKETMAADRPKVPVYVSAGDEILEMDRVRKLIAEHMVMSKRISPHVTNMIETDVTEIVLWRNRIKDEFQHREKEKITFLPAFLEAAIRTIKDYPMVNASVDGNRIIIRKNINLGIAVALPTGNLIVPVIKNADQLNLLGLTKSLNKLAGNARNNKLSPDDIQGGTFTVTNFGTFRNVMGTPIINQPQVAILAIGTIEKKPAVIETSTGDIIGIRHMMFLSLTYDHRVIDGAYGGAFLKQMADYLEAFDGTRTI